MRRGVPGRIRVAATVYVTAVNPEKAAEKDAHARNPDQYGADPRRATTSERTPETDREHEQEQAGQVRTELVVEPRTIGRHGSEVAVLVVDDAELVRLGKNGVNIARKILRGDRLIEFVGEFIRKSWGNVRLERLRIAVERDDILAAAVTKKMQDRYLSGNS